MPKLIWRNDADGFAFQNSWALDAGERHILSALAGNLIPAAIATVTAVTTPDPNVIAALWLAAHAYLEFGPLRGYGLCGGMAYPSLDHWHARISLPRGAHVGDQPTRISAASTAVRNMIWARLLDSLNGGGVLEETIEWSLILNVIPAWLGGGAGSILQATKQEWNAGIAFEVFGEQAPSLTSES